MLVYMNSLNTVSYTHLLFNQLTGSNQHVGNFPGVTVDRKSGAIKDHPETCLLYTSRCV